MPFVSFQLGGWRQFRDIEFSFDDRLTVITGENSTGKTALLRVLARSAGTIRNTEDLLGTVARNKDGRAVWTNSVQDPQVGDASPNIGRLTTDKGTAILSVAVPSNGHNVAIHFDNTELGPCIYFPAYRSPFRYSAVSDLPLVPRATHELFSDFRGHSGSISLIKSALIGLKFFGEPGPMTSVPDLEARRLYRGLEKRLGEAFPKSLGFESMEIEAPEVTIKTSSGTFPIEAMSSGLTSLTEIVWQLHLYDELTEDRYAVLIDEPEAHLHPEMQRQIITGLLAAFPRAQFVVATHSPFVATSSKDAAVYSLRRDTTGNVSSQRIPLNNRALDVDDALLEVLGLSSTMPKWAEDSFNEIVNRMLQSGASADSIKAMIDELHDAGLGDEVPEAIAEISTETLRATD